MANNHPELQYASMVNHQKVLFDVGFINLGEKVS
jgi:hypothetical protein